MASRSIEIVIRAKNALKAGLSKATGALKAFGARAKAVARGISAGMAVLAAAFAAVGVAVGKLAAMQVKAAISQAKLAAVLKATGYAAGFTRAQLNKEADALQDLTGISNETVLSVQTMLATFKEVKGDEFTRAGRAVLDMATIMEEGQATTAGLKAASIQLGKALNDPVANLGALTRVGIMFTASQKEQIKSFVEAGEVAKAQNIILKEVESQFGGAAAAAGSADYGISKFKETLGDAGEEMGKAIAEAAGLEGRLDGLRETVKALAASGQFEIWADDAKEAFKTLASGAASLGKTLYKELRLDKLIEAGVSGIQKAAAFAGGFAGAQGGAGERLAAGVQAAKDSSPEALAKYNQERLDAIQKRKEAEAAAAAAKEAALMAEAAAAQVLIDAENKAAKEKAKAQKEYNALKKKEVELTAQVAAEAAKAAKVGKQQGVIENVEKRIKAFGDAADKREAVAQMMIPALIAQQKGDKEQADAKLAEDKRINRLREKEARGIRLSKKDKEFLDAVQFREKERKQGVRDRDNQRKAQDKLKVEQKKLDAIQKDSNIQLKAIRKNLDKLLTAK